MKTETISKSEINAHFTSLVRTALAEIGDLIILDNITVIFARIGNVDFWIDLEGRFKNQLAYDLPIYRWDTQKIADDLMKHSK
jgi:hypothetical protein